MKFESNFNPQARNPQSGATGLIQFMPSTARGLGTTAEDIAAMDELDQLALVHQYFLPYAGKLRSLSDCYMAILRPRAVGGSQDDTLFEVGSGAYEGNAALDLDHDGRVTESEATSFVAKRLEEGLLPLNALRYASAEPQPEKPMPLPLLALLSAFGPLISELIPQVSKLFKPGSEVAQRNVGVAQIVVDTIVKASGQPNLQTALETMQADPAVREKVTQAVVTEPSVMAIIEVGGGIKAAAERDLAVMQQDKPFWKTSPVFYISLILLPMVYWYVGSSVVGGVKIPDTWPWYAQMPLKIFGDAWSLDARSGLANLVIGLILGGICGVYFGVSVTQQKQANTTKPGD
jgi:hypothetical protein